MKNIRISAVKINQIDKNEGDKREIYVGAIKVEDLINEGQFQIDYWDPAKKEGENQGYQRHPFSTHFKKISKYALASDAIFPGAILISCREKSSNVLFHDKGGSSGELELQHPPFWIIDGQHRIKGLKHCIEEEGDKKWLERELPVVILAHFTKIDEVVQFNTLNSTSKKVSTDLAQQLMLLRAMNDKDYRKSLKFGGEDWKIRCLKVIEKLNESEDSPWLGRIKGPNYKSGQVSRVGVGQNSFLVSLKPLYTSGYFESTRNIDHEYEVLKNYWGALKDVFPYSFKTPEESVIIKTPGIFSLHHLLRAILQRRGGSKENITRESFYALLKEVFSGKHDDFWSSDNIDGAALYGSMKGFKILGDEFVDSLSDVLEQ
jgi:DGQHR domain-containing protein